MKRIILPTFRSIPTLIIALSDKLKAELIASLESKKLFKVVNILTDGKDLFELLESQNPDYLLIDTELPNSGGFGFLKKLDRIKPNTKVIVYANNANPDYLKVFLASSAFGFIQKGCGLKDFVSSLQSVFEGKRLVFSQMSNFHQQSLHNYNENYKKTIYDLSTLTEREKDVWDLLLEAKMEKQIAEILFISINTVKTHKSNISKKLGLPKEKRLSTFAMYL